MANEDNQEMEHSFSETDPDELLTKMKTMNKKFRNSCSQVILLNNQIEYLQSRYDRAVRANKRSYRYFLRLRLATLEGIRNMFYEYACRRADELDTMQDRLVQEGIIDSDFDLEDSDNEQSARGQGQGDESFESEHAYSEQEGHSLDTSFQSEDVFVDQSNVVIQEYVPEMSTGQLNMFQNIGASAESSSSSGPYARQTFNETDSSKSDHNRSESDNSQEDVVIECAIDTVVMDTPSILDSIVANRPDAFNTSVGEMSRNLGSVVTDSPVTFSAVMSTADPINTVVIETPNDHSYADIVHDKQSASKCNQGAEEPMQS